MVGATRNVSGMHLPLIGGCFDVGATLGDNDDDGDDDDDDDGGGTDCYRRLLLEANERSSERHTVLLYVPQFQLTAGV